MNEKQGGHYISNRNGLKRIGVRMEGLPAEIEQVTLHQPSQQEQQAEALQ